MASFRTDFEDGEKGNGAEPPDRGAPPIGNDNEPAVELGEVDIGDIDLPEPRAWLLGTVFCRTFISSLIAEGGVGKTALRYAQYLSLASGRELTGEHVFERCVVLLVSLEDNLKELKRRLWAVMKQYGIDPEDVRGWLFFAAPGAHAGKLMTLDSKGRIVRGGLADVLERAIIRRRPALVALDPFVKSHGVAENDNNQVDQVAQLLADFADKYDMAVDAPHHVRKGAPDPGNADRGRGASANRDASRLVYTLTVMTADEASAFNIPEAERKLYIRMDSAKVNIARPSEKAKWFHLVGVKLGNGTDLYPNGDEVQTVEPYDPPKTWEGLDIAVCKRILDEIDKGLADGERYSDDNGAKNRAAWKAVKIHAPTKSEKQCKEIISKWVEVGYLVSEQYHSKAARKDVFGLRASSVNRPGARTDF